MVNKTYVFDVKQMLTIPAFSEPNMWDRTETITPNTSIQCLTPIGSLTNPLPVKDMCLARAKELRDLAVKQDKKIYVFWSGGLDSTSVFLSLREVASDRLAVMYTKNSLLEYPGFFESNIKDTHETHEFTMYGVWLAIEHACTNGIGVTGELADQMFGSVMFMGKSTEALGASWESFNRQLSEDLKFQELVSKCPIGIKTTADLLWWVNYTCKYQNVQIRTLRDNTVSKLNTNMFHFFDTQEFNDYAISTPTTVKIPGFDAKQYKKPLRDVIYNLGKDADYAYNKPKVRSLVPLYGRMSRNKIANTIDLNWVRGY